MKNSGRQKRLFTISFIVIITLLTLTQFTNCSGNLNNHTLSGSSVKSEPASSGTILFEIPIPSLSKSKDISTQFKVQASEPPAAATCSLLKNGSLFISNSDCSNLNFKASGLEDASYDLEINVRLINAELLTARKSFKIDTISPSLKFILTPPSITATSQTSVEFSITDTQSGIGMIQCSLNGGGFVPCESPWKGTVSTGTHNLRVKATDQAGNMQMSSPVSWTVDPSAPSISLSSKPNLYSNKTVSTFSFTGTSVARYECQFNSEAATPCTSPVNKTLAANSVHTFTLRAFSAAGLKSELVYNWTIDTLAPSDIGISGTPANSISSNPNAFINFSAIDNFGVASFQCSLDGSAFTICSSPQNFVANNGSHTFVVKAFDLAGNSLTSQVHNWTVDSLPPSNSFTSTPPASTASRTASFVFSPLDTGSGIASVQCSLDSAAFSSCTTPTTFNASNLSIGAHSLKVQTLDKAGNQNLIAYSWTISGTIVTPIKNKLGLTPCEPSYLGTDYQVGPASNQLAHLDLVPWENLMPGDTVRIFYSATPYRSKLVLGRKGTESAPIRVCGVKGPNGERPIIDGDGATTKLNLPIGALAKQQKGLILLVPFINSGAQTYPEHIQIDGLKLRNANPDTKFVAAIPTSPGALTSYSTFGACVYIGQGKNITIADNEITNCTQAIFSASIEGSDATISSNIRVAGNILTNNGIVGSSSVHTSYTQSIGVTYEYNYFGPLKTGALGHSIVDRSAGTVIRYNRFDGGVKTMELVDPEEFGATAIAQSSFRQTFVYGNQINKILAGPVLEYGGNHEGGESYYRKGTLYFFHNTVITNEPVGLFILSTLDETAEIWNNVFYNKNNQILLRSPSNIYSDTDTGGTLRLGVNWMNLGYTDAIRPLGRSPIFSGTIYTGTISPVDYNTFAPLAGSTVINTSGASLPAAGHHSIIYQLRYDGSITINDRITNGSNLDLGAIEF